MKKIILSFLLIIFLAITSYYSLLAYISTRAEKDNKKKSDVILILGGMAFSDSSCYGPICNQPGFVKKPRLNVCLVARVNHAVSLYKRKYAKKILMTGGTDKETGINEAETMKQIAVKAGVPAKNILLEKKATSTYENFTLSQPILERAGLDSVIVVSDPYHHVRSGLIAKKLRYTYSLSPTVKSPCWEQNKNKPFTNRDSRREVFALLYYKLLGRI